APRWQLLSAGRLTRISMGAGFMNGTRRRRLRWHGQLDSTRPASTDPRWPITRPTFLCPIFWSAGPRLRVRCCKRSGKSRMRPDYQLSQLDVLEAEAIHIMREVGAEFERPVLLFSGGKDSIVMLALAEKAFWPARIPFPVMHVDTGHNFPEVLEFRDRRVAELSVRLIVASVQESIDAGRVAEETGRHASRNRLQTVTLLDAIEEHRFDALFGGTRRRPGPRSGCSRSGTSSASGTPRTSGPNCGTCTTRGCTGVSTSGCSPCPTGPSLTSGRTSSGRNSTSRPSTTRTTGRCSSGTACCWPTTPTGPG